ncbi:MAG TPA: metallophosphoesterase [Candidatus Cybelea sp.]|nr:metallophosphoesterase [Candidatus Cybelea sp.]
MPSLTVAHISDLHIGPMPRPGLAALAGKRVTGFLSWQLRRSRIHRREVLQRLADDLHTQTPDHIAVTGDLVNISLPAEFAEARDFLRHLGPPEKVTVIPGNHDAYVALPWAPSLGLWAEYMSGGHVGEADEREPRAIADFPFVRRRDGVALIGLSTAIPTRPFSAAGELGQAQLGRLSILLDKLAAEGLFRVVLIHHPPFGGGTYRRKSLRDAEAFADVIRAKGCELVLHGHTHMSALARLKGANGPVPVIGVPSASAVLTRHRDPSRYHIYRIGRAASGGWHLDVSVRELLLDGSGYAAAGEIAMLNPLVTAQGGPERAVQPECA